MDVIIPCAGLSSRFPDMKPKYLLEDFQGNMMIQLAMASFANCNIHIVILKEHDEKYDVLNLFRQKFGTSINLIVLNERTKGPADTVFQALERIDANSSVLVRDCDSAFSCALQNGNYVFVYPAENLDSSVNRKSLGYAFIDGEKIKALSEKNLESDFFCVGGYQFDSKQTFIDGYLTSSQVYGEIYLSHVINACIGLGHEFKPNQVKNYKSFGNLELWHIYNSK